MPPLVWRVQIYLAGCLVPAGARADWRRQWSANLAAWHVLVQRGELPAGTGANVTSRAWHDAVHERFGVVGFHRFLRGPLFLASACMVSLLLIAAASSGFTTARALIELMQDVRLHPDLGVRYDLRGDRLMEYFAPMVISASIGIALLFLKRRSLRSLGWRSWSFLAFKLMALYVISCLLWVEGGHGLRSHLTRPILRLGVAGLGLAIVFIIGFGVVTLWCVADQRRRCPVCLHRLMMPVTMGSWASIFFDPAATELVCEEGHGSLSLVEAEAAAGPLDRWIVLDDSWQYLFHENPAGTKGPPEA